MRRAARVDGNHAEIVKRLREFGAGVRSLASMGEGLPDLLIGFRGQNYLLELKDPSRKPSERRLTEDEAEFHKLWPGQLAIVETAAEALGVIGVRLR